MSALNEMYNWNGIYKLKKDFEPKRYKVSDLDYPEYLHIMMDKDDYIIYTVFDEKFGYPALCNTHKGEYSVKVRGFVVEILDKLESEGYIEKVC